MRYAGSKRAGMPGRAVAAAGAIAAIVAAVPPMASCASGKPSHSIEASTLFPSASGFACIQTDGEEDYCPRLVRDLSLRDTLTEADRAKAARRLEGVRTAVFRAELAVPESATCPPATVPPPGPCMLVRNVDPIPYADAIRRALSEAGFADAIVRVARTDDPAPAGGVVYAVPLDLRGSDSGTVCVLGHSNGNRSGGMGPMLVGTRPGGICMST